MKFVFVLSTGTVTAPCLMRMRLKQPERNCDERSDEWKLVSYVGMRYSAFAVASLKPSFAPRSASPPPWSCMEKSPSFA